VARRAEIPALTGLRGIAALCVVLNHYGGLAPFAWQTAPHWLMTLFAISDRGMTLFFTLSGFVITYNYFDYPWQTSLLHSLIRFAWLRFSRLYPLLLLFLLIHTDWTAPLDLWTALHFASLESWVPLKLGGALPIDGRFSVSWSISTEFALYSCFALAMLSGARFRRVALTVYAPGVILLVLSPQTQRLIMTQMPVLLEPLTENEQWNWLIYQGPLYRLLEFAIGAAIARLVLRDPPWRKAAAVQCLPWIAVGLILAGQWFAYVGDPVPPRLEERQLVWSLCYAAIMLTADLGGLVARFLSLVPLVFLGEISYSLYLFHLSAPAIAGLSLNGQGPYVASALPIFVYRLALGLLVAIAVAVGLYRVVERPAQRALRAIGPQPKPATIRSMPTIPLAAE